MEEEKKTVEDGEKNGFEELADELISGLKSAAERAQKTKDFGRQMGIVLATYGQIMAGDTMQPGMLALLKASMAGAGEAVQALLDEVDGKGEAGRGQRGGRDA